MPVVAGAGAYTWTAPPGTLINGQDPPVTVPAPGGNVVSVTVGPTGGQICVTPNNSCDEGTERCKNIVVQPIPPTILTPAVVCNEDIPYELPWGDLVSNSGTFEVTLTSYQGCDSVVRQQVTVKPPIIKFLAPQTVCAGQCITVCGEEYCDGGNYSHVCESYQGCDSTINFSLIVLDPVAQIIPNGVITCSNSSVVLNSAASPGTKIWKTLSGQVLGTGATLTVTQPQTVVLTVTASGGGNFCIKNDTLVVTGNTTPPNVTATGGVLGCGNAQAQLSSSTNAANATYAWGPATGLSATNISNPIATLGGVYTVTVTDPSNGCTNTASVTVAGNTTPPPASATGGILTCTNTTIPISAATNVSMPTFNWTGPAGFSSTSQNPTVGAAGTYTVTITDLSNNCTATATASVTLNNTPPSASATGGTISCTTPTITLNGNSPTPGVSYSWIGSTGATFNVQNPDVTAAGAYTVTVLNPANGCTSTATTTVNGDTNPPTASATGGTVSCGQPNLTLAGGSTTPAVTFAWAGPGGFSSNLQNPAVTVPGIYTLTVTATNNCTQTATATVNGDFGVPDASATGGVITCSSTSTTVNGASTTPGAIFQWIGPGGNVFNGASPTVSNVGVYTLTVTAPNGCTATASATVAPDANVPNASAAGGTLNCTITSIMLDGGSITPGVTLSWIGPNNFTSVVEDPVVADPGVYTLTVSNPANGCTAVATANVILDDAAPGATANGGTVTCAQPDLNLTGTSSANNVTWAWSGPGFTSVEQNPSVSTAGTYTLVVTGQNGCTSSAVATVLADQTLPVPSATTGTLTCALTNLTLNGSANVAVTFNWNGPSNFSSTAQNPSVSQPGDYTLIVTATNGCVDSITVTVDQDIAPPNISASGNTISCTNPQVSLTGASTTNGATFLWLGPNSFNSTAPSPLVNANGTYTLRVTGPNGCTSEQSVDVSLDTEVPIVFAQPSDILTCATTTIDLLTTATNASSPVQSYAWTGPNSFASSNEDPAITVPGTYTVVVTSANGCATTATATVNQDITPPNVSALGGTLTCVITEIQLAGGSTTPNASFSWQGPGFTSPLQNPTINAEGDYTLTVTGPNGCTASATASVVLDGDFPDATAVSSNNLDCDELASQLTGTSSVANVTYTWTDPAGNIIGITANVTVSAPGAYELAVTAPNGCVTNANVLITQDIALPGATALGDTIDCITGQTPITGGSSTLNVTWQWNGPGGFTSSQQSPVVSQDGVYTLTVTGLNACTSTATATVTENTASPVVTVNGAGTLTCLVTDLTLTGTISTPGAVGVWTGPGGAVVSATPTVNVSSPGVYTYTVTAPNGCISAPTLTVAQDIVTPQNVIVTGGLINCSMPTLPLTASTSTPNVAFNWTGPGGFTSTQQNPTINAAGTYTVLLTNQANGCQATAVTSVTSDFAQPSGSIITEIITCSLPTVTLDLNTNTPNVQFNWAGPGITAANQKVEDPQVSVAGTYTVTITAQNGCTSVFPIIVFADKAAPNISTTGTTLSCAQPSRTITGASQTAGVTYSWTGPGGFTSAQPSPTVNVPGNYILTVTAPNGCTSTSVAVVNADDSLPTVSAAGGILTCTVTSIQLTGATNNAAVTWLWSGPAGFTSTAQNPTVGTSGSYNVTVTAPNGCTATASASVQADTEGPEVITGVPEQLDCTTSQVSLSATAVEPGNYTYQWTTQAGNILSGAFSQNPVVSTAAVYNVVVTDQQNGCSTTEDVVVINDSTTVSGAILSVRNVSCFGKTDGVIGVNSVVGGTPPFLYSLDNLPLVPSAFFTSLAPGSHLLLIQDANGCEWETTLEVGEPEELLVDLGPDVIVPLGHTIQLSLNNTVNFPDRVESLVLDPSSLDSVFCDTCSGILKPFTSFRYFVTVVDSNGCKATDNRTIIVDKTRYVYIPNAFNPEASDNDAIFYISGDTRQIRIIKSFRVFDRWGNAVHERFNFMPNHPASGWDGSIRGDKANPAVFVYYAEIEFIDDEVILYKGDVTLFRE
ncbi:MAG: gliding motility-associated C-terminal domain-containing protein [Saprospirales bacterium]|nr:gliding motility-associated C-terminal domain-containing protein [Saprospirales bacterium]